MYGSAMRQSGYIGANGKNRVEQLYPPDQLILFEFFQKGLELRLTLSETLASVQDNVTRRTVRGALARREVEFVFLTALCHNDFAAMSKVLALITAAERNQFGGGHKEMRMSGIAAIPSWEDEPEEDDEERNEYEHMHAPHYGFPSYQRTKQKEPKEPASLVLGEVDFFIRRAQFKSGGYGLTLGLDDKSEQWSVDLPIFWVHHLKQSLQKSMSWLKPGSGLEAWE